MDGREIWVLRARAETGELGEALIEDLAMPLRSRPDLPGRGVPRRRDRCPAVLPPRFVQHPTSDFRLRSDIVRGDGHLANLLAVEPVRATNGRDSLSDPVEWQPVGDKIGEGVLARLN